MRQEVLLALLAKEPSPGYQLRARLNDALGSLGEEMNDGQIYVTFGRLGEGRPGGRWSDRRVRESGRSARCTRSPRRDRPGWRSG